MLKTFASKFFISTLSIGIIYPLFKPSSVEAISFTFYQKGFVDNGFIIGKFWGTDKDNDGYINFSYDTDISTDDDKFDSGSLSISYFSDYSPRIYISPTDIDYYSWEYSISSNQLRGYTEKMFSGVDMSQKKGTCVWSWDLNLPGDYVNLEASSSSPLEIVNQALPSQDNSGNNSSTKVPEPSSILSLLAVGVLSAGSALLRRQKQ